MIPFLPISHYFPELKVHNITFFAFWISWQLQVYAAIYSQNITKSLKKCFWCCFNNIWTICNACPGNLYSLTFITNLNYLKQAIFI